MAHWEMRKKEQEIEAREEMESILMEAKYVTVAMCHEGEPYLVALSHGYDPRQRAIFFHCDHEGKKTDILRENPVVWGQAVRDLGVKEEECDHHYATTMFRGKVSFPEEMEEKRHALAVLVGQFGADVDKFFAKEDSEERIKAVNIGRIDIEYMSGKHSGD